MFKLVLEKAEEPEIKLPTSSGSSKKAREFQKNIYFCFIDYAKAFDCVDHNKLWKMSFTLSHGFLFWEIHLINLSSKLSFEPRKVKQQFLTIQFDYEKEL